MPANWAVFTANMIKFLSATDSESAAESAEFIATEYDTAVSTAGTVLQNLVTGGTNKSALQSAFETGFSTMEKLQVAPTLPIFTLMSAGVVAYWAAATFNPMPPHPPTIAPSTGIQILVPGLPTPLDAQLMTAFMAGTGLPDATAAATAVATALTTAFSAHLLMISGIYNGMILVPPSPTPVPGPPIPWVGIL